MNKKLNAFLRILTVIAAVAAVVFAFLLKGKMDAALTKTLWAVNDAEVKAGKDYDARMTSLASLPGLLDAKRKAIADLELAKKDLTAEVADKKTKIEGLTAANATLEGERAELTRKRDELSAQLTDANSKKDGAVAELTAVKEDLVRATEKVNNMYTKEQLAEIEAKATKAEELSTALRSKYAALHNWASRASESPAPGGFQRDPFAEPVKEGTAAPASSLAVAVEAATDTIPTNILALDARSGIVAFSVGEANGIKESALFSVKVDGREVGKVKISSVKGALSFGQLQPGKELDLSAIAKAGTVSLTPSTKLASN
jgi:hypothetical protein